MSIKAKHIVITGAIVGIGVWWYSTKIDKWKQCHILNE